MNQFAKKAQASAQGYYDWLKKEGKGCIEYTVCELSLVGDNVLLRLSGKLSGFDEFKIKIHNVEYSQEEMKVINFDEASRSVLVHPQPAILPKLLGTKPADVILITDMKFLVKGVREWYGQYGGEIQLPTSPYPILREDYSNLMDQPSPDQQEAIHGALTNPFTYIWGAPGTGKTRFVLARCVLPFVQNNRRVLITAPTNNAVEQALRGVLEVMKEAGINYTDKVARLGIASAEFMSSYPEVCENTTFAKRLAEIERQLDLMHSKMELLQRCENFYQHFNRYSESVCRIKEFFDEMLEHQTAKTELERNIDVLKGRITVAEQECLKLKKLIERCTGQIAELNAEIKRCDGSIFRIVLSQKRKNAVARLEQTLKELDQLETKERKNNADLATWNAQRDEKISQSDIHSALIWQCVENAVRQTGFWYRDFQSEIQSAFVVSSAEQLQQVFDKYDCFMKERRTPYTELLKFSEQEREEELSNLVSRERQLVAEKQCIEESNEIMNISQCCVIGATIDTCIRRLPPNDDNKFNHIFLDEAGYCSLIKGVTLTAYHCPITMLGDHMQLPPVCEATEEVIEEMPEIGFWAISALYTEFIFLSSAEFVESLYWKRKELPSNIMIKHDLTQTFRFGTKLAKVLSKKVYSQAFCGNDACNTEVLFLDSSKVTGNLLAAKEKRQNPKEVAEIVNYCTTHCSEQIGIITPYTNQKKLIIEGLRAKKLPADDVLTVHGSQGREWDTVLFSVSDNAQNMYFTDSENPKSGGLYVINTAVSRAKKKLVIVCDYSDWSKKKKQLIGQILSVAKNCE